ncbi:MAG: hypothetical protein ACFE0J_11055 [Elainellaceae cyanobacterium]
MNEQHEVIPSILLIEQDDETRPLLRENLLKQGYRVIMAWDEEDAIDRTRDGRESPSLILINQFKFTNIESVDMGRRIRQHAGFSIQIPIVVIADKFGAELEGENVKVNGNEYVSYPEDAQQLMNLLRTLCKKLP